MGVSTEDVDPHSFVVAAEFSRLVGATDLLDYLALTSDTPSKTAQEALRARRKRMQGMQSNPKYKDEALFLIKHFSELASVLGHPESYQADLKRRRAREHLPGLELAMRTALAAGSIGPEQESVFRQKALDWGIDFATFQDTLDRLRGESARPKLATPSRSNPAAATVNYYGLLGVSSSASLDEIGKAYRASLARAERHPDAQVANAWANQIQDAWAVLSDAASRARFDRSPVVRATQDGAPTRMKGRPTASPPPSSPRAGGPDPMLVSGDGLPARLEWVGDHVRLHRPGRDPASWVLGVRNGGDQAMPARIRTDVPWMTVEPVELDPLAKLQSVTVTIDTRAPPGAIGQIVASGGLAGNASLRVEIARKTPWAHMTRTAMMATVPLIGLTAVVALAAWWVSRRPEPAIVDPVPPAPWTIAVTPVASEIRVNGDYAGRGQRVALDAFAGSVVDLQVFHPNFPTVTQRVKVKPGTITAVTLTSPRTLDFVPDPSHVRANVPAREADPALAWVSAGFDNCARQTASSGDLVTGTILVHVDGKGVARGLQITGDQVEDSALRACVEPLAAAVFVPPLLQGDYATLRYDYAVTGRAQKP